MMWIIWRQSGFSIVSERFNHKIRNLLLCFYGLLKFEQELTTVSQETNILAMIFFLLIFLLVSNRIWHWKIRMIDQIFSWFVGLPEAGLAQLRPLPGWVPVICLVLESPPRDCTCLTNLRQPRSFSQWGLLWTHGLGDSAFNSMTKRKMYTPFNPEIPVLRTYSAKKT